VANAGRAFDVEARRQRAERILDAAAELLLRLGYKRVTIEDVAERAAIGKGTVYLHWRSREALFYAVLEREYVAILEGLLAALRRDLEEALLHRMTRTYFLTTMGRPLVRAALIGDMELLGRIAKAADTRALRGRGAAVFDEYLRLLHANGLLRPDVDPRELHVAYRATLGGYFIADPQGDPHQVPLERRAELLSDTMRRTFEPSTPPPAAAVRAVAPRVIELFTELADLVRAHMALAYEHE
jgi:AcrR family transcriptional regulator